ncbi:MAG: hypothetical protein ACOYKD_03885 [Anaerolineaceae bacterium]|jgi:hypothetical protein
MLFGLCSCTSGRIPPTATDQANTTEPPTPTDVVQPTHTPVPTSTNIPPTSTPTPIPVPARRTPIASGNALDKLVSIFPEEVLLPMKEGKMIEAQYCVGEPTFTKWLEKYTLVQNVQSSPDEIMAYYTEQLAGAKVEIQSNTEFAGVIDGRNVLISLLQSKLADTWQVTLALSGSEEELVWENPYFSGLSEVYYQQIDTLSPVNTCYGVREEADRLAVHYEYQYITGMGPTELAGIIKSQFGIKPGFSEKETPQYKEVSWWEEKDPVRIWFNPITDLQHPITIYQVFTHYEPLN